MPGGWRFATMRHKLMPLLAILAVVLPSVAAADHETRDERPPTPLAEFRDAVDEWLDPWLVISGTSIADDHAPWVAIGLYELLLGIKPEPCYHDTYAAYWAVAADLRALGQAPTRELMERATERVLESLARADTLAELDALHCVAMGADVAEVVGVETSPSPDADSGIGTGPSRVIEIEATATLQFVDESGGLLKEIGVTPGETVLFRVHNTADFDHTFYIGSESTLREPQGTTDVGIGTWYSGVRELEWTMPDDVSGSMFGCTVPGHYSVMHGMFTSTATVGDTSSG
jgi:hypothetical protein